MPSMSAGAPGLYKVVIGQRHAWTPGEVTGEIVQDGLEDVIQVLGPLGHVDIRIETEIHAGSKDPLALGEENQDGRPGRASGVPFDGAGREGVMNTLTDPSVKQCPVRPV